MSGSRCNGPMFPNSKLPGSVGATRVVESLSRWSDAPPAQRFGQAIIDGDHDSDSSRSIPCGLALHFLISQDSATAKRFTMPGSVLIRRLLSVTSASSRLCG